MHATTREHADGLRDVVERGACGKRELARWRVRHVVVVIVGVPARVRDVLQLGIKAGVERKEVFVCLVGEAAEVCFLTANKYRLRKLGKHRPVRNVTPGSPAAQGPKIETDRRSRCPGDSDRRCPGVRTASWRCRERLLGATSTCQSVRYQCARKHVQ